MINYSRLSVKAHFAYSHQGHARIEKVLTEGVQLNSDNDFLIFYLVNEESEDKNPLKAGYHRFNDDGPALNAGLVAL